jgi:hypothetical protein
MKLFIWSNENIRKLIQERHRICGDLMAAEKSWIQMDVESHEFQRRGLFGIFEFGRVSQTESSDFWWIVSDRVTIFEETAELKNERKVIRWNRTEANWDDELVLEMTDGWTMWMLHIQTAVKLAIEMTVKKFKAIGNHNDDDMVRIVSKLWRRTTLNLTSCSMSRNFVLIVSVRAISEIVWPGRSHRTLWCFWWFQRLCPWHGCQVIRGSSKSHRVLSWTRPSLWKTEQSGCTRLEQSIVSIFTSGHAH